MVPMTSKLIVLNGPPGVGKSTMAKKYVEDHLLALRVDVDELRGWLGRWSEDPEESGRRARALAVAMARTHLPTGHDVVIAQLYGQVAYLVELEQVASDCGSGFAEIMLMADVEDVVARFVERGGPRLDEVTASAEGLDRVRDLHARVVAVGGARPNAKVIEPSWGDVSGTYDTVIAALGR